MATDLQARSPPRWPPCRIAPIQVNAKFVEHRRGDDKRIGRDDRGHGGKVDSRT